MVGWDIITLWNFTSFLKLTGIAERSTSIAALCWWYDCRYYWYIWLMGMEDHMATWWWTKSSWSRSESLFWELLRAWSLSIKALFVFTLITCSFEVTVMTGHIDWNVSKRKKWKIWSRFQADDSDLYFLFQMSSFPVNNMSYCWHRVVRMQTCRGPGWPCGCLLRVCLMSWQNNSFWSSGWARHTCKALWASETW